jgi:hypothetical protein
MQTIMMNNDRRLFYSVYLNCRFVFVDFFVEEVCIAVEVDRDRAKPMNICSTRIQLERSTCTFVYLQQTSSNSSYIDEIVSMTIEQ